MDLLSAVNGSIAQLAARIRRLEALPRGHIPPDAVLFDHFAGDGTLDARWTTALIGTGTVTLPNAAPSYVRLDSGATAGGIARLAWFARPCLVGMDASCWLRARFRFPNAPFNAGSENTIGLLDSYATFANYIRVGQRGASSVGFITVEHQSAGAGAINDVTAVPIDAAWHELYIQTFPALARIWIDNAFVIELTAEIPTGVALMPFCDAYNGGTNASRQTDIEWIAVDEAAI